MDNPADSLSSVGRPSAERASCSSPEWSPPCRPGRGRYGSMPHPLPTFAAYFHAADGRGYEIVARGLTGEY